MYSTRDWNPWIPNPGIGGIPIPGFWDYKKIVKIVFFRVLNDRNKNFFAIWWIKYLCALESLLFAVHCNSYFDKSLSLPEVRMYLP